MKKVKLISALSTLSALAATPIIATSCSTSETTDSKIKSITLSSNSVSATEETPITVSAKCPGTLSSVQATSEDTTKLKIERSGTDWFIVRGIAEGNNITVDLTVKDSDNNIGKVSFLFNVLPKQDTTVKAISIIAEETTQFAPVSYDNTVTVPVGYIDFKLFNAEGQEVQKGMDFTINTENKPSWMSEVYIDTDGSIYVSRSGDVPTTDEVWSTKWSAEVDGVKTEEYDISFMYVPNFDQNGFIVWQDTGSYKIYKFTDQPTGQVTQTQINAFAKQTGNVEVTTTEGKVTVKKENIVTLGIQNTTTSAYIPDKFCVNMHNLCYVDLKGFETHITKIPDHFMYDCQSLQEIYLNFPAVKTIGQFFLASCKSLAKVDFSKMTAVTKIGNGCLYQSTGLESIDVSGLGNVQTIDGVFAQYVSNLTEINFGEITLDKLKTSLNPYSFTCGSADDKSFKEGILLEGTYAKDFLKYLPKIENYTSKLFRNCYVK